MDALKRQSIVAGNTAIAEGCATIGELHEYAPTATIIAQGASDNAIHLILAGQVSIIVNGREVAQRQAHQHVGEMALIDSAAVRSASVVARETVVTFSIAEPGFSALAHDHPEMWRRLALESCNRLRQRNASVRARNETPIMFVGSSSESKALAYGIQQGLEHDPVIVRVWTDGVFGPSGIPVDDLLAQTKDADFAVLVVGPDDKVASRGSVTDAPRDNIIFEIGAFMGGLGRERTVMVKPRGIDLKIPSDLHGVTPLGYDPNRISALPTCLGPVCTSLRGLVDRLGSR